MTKKILVALLVAVTAFQMAGLQALATPVKQGGAVAAAAPISPTDSSKVPHYFGPYPNWANSPQTLADAVVTLTGGGGAGAEATASVDPKTGAISAMTVTKPGSGYTSPPTVDITSPGVTPTATAAATAAISLGVVKSIAVAEAGFGFTAPAVTITGGGVPTIPATATASGGVDDVTLTNGGSGYTIQPIVKFSLPDLPTGTPATGTATMDANGVVTAVSVVDAGLRVHQGSDGRHPRRQPGQPRPPQP